MARRKVVDVKPNKQEGGWDVTERGGGQVSHHKTKEPAINRAKREAKAADLGQVVIRKQDGTVQTEHTYGEDPRRRKG